VQSHPQQPSASPGYSRLVRVVGTAGHVDHGKSTLIRQLTGTDPDRLAEEQRRGLTIDLGFAATVLPSGAQVGFVDVPGHGRFVKNMLAGVGAIDACMFVVAANEGWKPQSEEHLRILELLGISHGILVLTKVSLVDADTVELVRLELADRLGGSFLERAEVVAVDAEAGIGLEGDGGLVAALERLLADTPEAVDADRPRLFVDRSFALAGPGTVVTGTLTGGRIALADRLVIEPGHTTVRVRSLHSHGQPLTEARPGRRLALSLSGVSHREVRRGQAIVRGGQWHVSATVDASLRVLAGLGRAVNRRGAFVAHIGSGEYPVRLSFLAGRPQIEPGETGLVRMRIPDGLPLLPGDRYVLRESGRGETVGGGEILDVEPVLAPSKARPTRSADRVVAERGFVDVDELERLTGERRAPNLGHWVVDPAGLAGAEGELRHTVESAGRAGVDLAALTDLQRALVPRLDDLVVAGTQVLSAELVRATPSLESHPYLAALVEAPFSPPPPEGVDRAELRLLEHEGLVVKCDDVWFAASAIASAAQIIAGLLAADNDGVTVSAVRAALGTTRRYVVPLLGHLDATGVTRRRGDLRISGPRLPIIDTSPR
jgi:selenocysteine-specific elongation factor